MNNRFKGYTVHWLHARLSCKKSQLDCAVFVTVDEFLSKKKKRKKCVCLTEAGFHWLFCKGLKNDTHQKRYCDFSNYKTF